MTRQKIEWLLPSTPESLLMLDDPVEGLRPKWLAPGLAGDALQIDDLGRLTWKPIPPAPPSPTVISWPLTAPDGTLAAPSYSFAAAPTMGMLRDTGPNNRDRLTLAGADGTVLFLTTEADVSWGATGVAAIDARGGGWYYGTWQAAVNDIRTAMYVYTPSQNESLALHMIDGSGVASLSADSHLHLVAHASTTPYAESRWVLNGDDSTLTLPGPIRALDGTPTAPSYSFASAPGLGMRANLDAPATPWIEWREPTGGYVDFGSYDSLPAGGTELDVHGRLGTTVGLGVWENTGEESAYLYSLKPLEVHSAASVALVVNGAHRWDVPVSGHFLPGVDNGYDLGDPTHQIRDLYLAGSIFIDGVPLTPGGMTNPMTAPADLIVGGTAGAPTRLGVGTNTQVLTVVSGALAWATPASGGMTNPMTAVGDLIRGGTSGAPTRLAVGANGTWLTLSGGVPTWASLPVDPGFANPMTAVGDLIRGGTSGAPTRLAVGSNGNWLTLAGGVPTWAALPVDPGFANPMTTAGDVIIGGASGAPARLGIGTTGRVLTVVAGAPAWAAPSAGVTVVPLSLDAARLPEGSTNNLFPQPVERVSTGTAPSGAPKVITLTYQFDQAGTVPAGAEFLLWRMPVPASYSGGAITLVSKWSMVSAITGNIRPVAALAPVVDSSTDVRAAIFNTPSFSADVAVPATLGQQKEIRIGPLDATNVAAGRTMMVMLGMWAATASDALNDRVLEDAWLEFA